jgi:drug/metabolite transporter (DMT)-like permease
MRLKADLTLLLVAAVWGSGFVAQRTAARSLSALYFNGGRFMLAAVLLLGLTRFRWTLPKKSWWKVALAGALLFGGAWFQQAGLATTAIGNASFITGLYVVLVPIILSLFARHKISWVIWTAALLAVVGIGLLSLTGSFKLSPGDSLELAGAFLWALHVILVGRFSREMEILQLSIGQFVVCGLLNLVLAVGFDPQGVTGFASSWQAVVYSSLFPICLGFTLQAAGQRHAPPADSAIILSLEAVFGALFGYLLLHEMLNTQQLIGCALMLAAMILSQVKAAGTCDEDAAAENKAGSRSWLAGG